MSDLYLKSEVKNFCFFFIFEVAILLAEYNVLIDICVCFAANLQFFLDCL